METVVAKILRKFPQLILFLIGSVLSNFPMNPHVHLLVCRSVQLHFQAPIGALVFLVLRCHNSHDLKLWKHDFWKCNFYLQFTSFIYIYIMLIPSTLISFISIYFVITYNCFFHIFSFFVFFFPFLLTPFNPLSIRVPKANANTQLQGAYHDDIIMYYFLIIHQHK